MYTGKKFLLIAGGGTLGTYVSQELLRLGAFVEVICPEEKVSDHQRLSFHRSLATEALLRDLFSKTHYDGIVNFIHYADPEEYKKVHPLLMSGTDHLIFLSSYRVYADEQHPVTETAPRLLDVVTDPHFLETEKYAIPKAQCEDYLRNERAGERWTIVRPVISFSDKRLDLLLFSGHKILRAVQKNEELVMPEVARDYTAGLDWAGNTGKLIANLLCKPDAMGEAFTIYSGHGMTWGQVAEVYQKVTGVKIRWDSEEAFFERYPRIKETESAFWAWQYDRRYNRDIDAAKVLRVTGLTNDDFTSVEDGLRHELNILNEKA